MATPPIFTAGAILTAAQMNVSGLWLIKSQVVGTAVSSVLVSDVFSADFDNYRVIYSGGVGSGPTGLALRVGGATTNYSHMLFWGTPGVAGVNTDSTTSTSQCNYLGGMTTSAASLSCDVLAPFISTVPTVFNAGAYMAGDMGICSGRHNVAQSNTSVTLVPMGGANVTGGTIAVYGYRK